MVGETSNKPVSTPFDGLLILGRGPMIRLPLLVLLSSAIAGASPLSWNWDVFQSANSLNAPPAYRTTPDAINSLANTYLTDVRDVANWLPPITVLSDLYSPSDGGGEIGVGVHDDLSGDNETAPSSLTEPDRSNPANRPKIVGGHKVRGGAPHGEGSY
jgi:hypothetical protein